MKRYLHFLCSIFCSAFLYSCAPQFVTYSTYDSVSRVDKALNSWIGTSELDVMRNFGTPDNSYADDRGNKTIRYYGKTIKSSSGVVVGNFTSSTSTYQTYYIDFLFDSRGKVSNQRNNYPKVYDKYEYRRKETSLEAKERINNGLLTTGAIIVGVVLGLFIL